MAIDLLNRFTQTQVNTNTMQSTEMPKNVDSAVAARIMNTVLNMRAGDVLRGQLISANGKDISLLLGDSVLLSAKMEKELMLQPGQMMSFTVGSNQNGKLSLRPLFANTGMEQNAMKALDAANIPVTDKTLALAEEMMRQGMPVNKQSLSAVYRQMGMYPEANITDLVMLHKMNIPVNEENLSMMRLYQTNQHYLFSDMQGLSSQMADFLSDMVQTQSSDAAQSFIRGFLEIFQFNATADPAMAKSAAGEAQMTDNGQNVVLQNLNEGLKSEMQNNPEGLAPTTADGKTVIQDNTVQNPNLMPEETMLKEAELLKILQRETLKTEGSKDALTQNLFVLLKEQFLMKPEDVQSAESIRSFYERLNEQVDKLQELMKNVGQEESALGKEVNTVKSNIQFMNQINEMYHYVQLPLKMNQEGANGDLYVYKRKQARTGDDGKLTALLHLSMPTLGNMDVFLALEDQKLSTRFCLEKEEMIDFIEGHIDQLNERLIKRGYQVQTSVTKSTREEEKTVIDEIMTTQPSIPVLTSQSFDARC